MATSTLHRQQQKTGSWSTIFPTEQVTEQQSALFVKKLLAVAISNITYLRTIFPEHAFGDRCLEDLNLKILRDDSACPGACQVIQWVKGCFDALDKKYLRMIMVGIYVDANDPTTVVETYTFKFSYNHHEGISIFRNGNKIASAYTEAETRKATIKLLRTIVVLTQTLKPLPDDVMMTMKLLYYDEVTPSEYEPPGFQCTTTDDFLFKEEPMNIRVGDVATPFHTVKLRIRTECQQFTLEEKEEAMDTTGNPTPPLSHPRHLKSHNPTSAHQLQPKEQETSVATGDASEPMQAAVEMPPSIPPHTDSQHQPGGQPQEGGGEEMEGRGEREQDDEQQVRCPCGCNEDDGLMVLCGLCRVWQHAVCFALLREEDVPELHVCELCSSEGEGEGQPCTDAFLQFLSPVALQATCLWRRALLTCSEMNRVLTPRFAKRLGVEITVAQGLVNRLEREGFIRSPAKGKRLGKVVNKDKIRLEGMRKYFEKTRKEATTKPLPRGSPPRSSPPHQRKEPHGQQGCVESLAEQASSLNISAAGCPSKPPSALPKLDECEVRRSPRIAKRVRSVTDQSVEFDLSSSQDPDAYIDTNEGRRKRRKASIASRSILV